jgi:hypothetical protein
MYVGMSEPAREGFAGIMTFATRLPLRSISFSRTIVTSTSKGKDSSTLMSSASLVVVNSSNEVLLVHRNPKATSFAGMHVRLDRYELPPG